MTNEIKQYEIEQDKLNYQNCQLQIYKEIVNIQNKKLCNRSIDIDIQKSIEW